MMTRSSFKIWSGIRGNPTSVVLQFNYLTPNPSLPHTLTHTQKSTKRERKKRKCWWRSNHTRKAVATEWKWIRREWKPSISLCFLKLSKLPLLPNPLLYLSLSLSLSILKPVIFLCFYSIIIYSFWCPHSHRRSRPNPVWCWSNWSWSGGPLTLPTSGWMNRFVHFLKY